ncbi:MAG TPA: DUF535 family protein [Acidobacteriaceae bacterium]|nr:DUF535 family protein [Acidobacteriaceae bacterium]
MAGQRYYWSSPSRLGRILWSITSNITRQFEIFRILSLPAFNQLVLLDPVFPFKYLSTIYLVGGLSAKERASCFVHHYQFLEARLPRPFLRQRHQREITLFERREGDRAYAIALGFPPKNAIWEGESSLQLLVNGISVYALQFTFIPGRVFRWDEKDVVVILRLQGMKGRYEEVRSATKALGEVAPQALLVAALQGIAKAWGIQRMAGICAASQGAHKYAGCSASLFHQAYDEFFEELGATRMTANFYSSPLPLNEKPLNRIRNGHKSRTLRKRAFKLQIADEVCRFLKENSPQVAEPFEVSVRRHGVEVGSEASSAA